jgi:hypothetical protein
MLDKYQDYDMSPAVESYERIPKILSEKAEISKQRKNWYVCIEGCIITVNA